jgi:hypothetical protein
VPNPFDILKSIRYVQLNSWLDITWLNKCLQLIYDTDKIYESISKNVFYFGHEKKSKIKPTKS